MNALINIPKSRYNEIVSGIFDADSCFKINLTLAFRNGTPIPDNATNGDVIKAIFDVTEEHFYDEDRMVDVYGLDRSDDPSTFYADWWNAPYQKGGKVE